MIEGFCQLAQSQKAFQGFLKKAPLPIQSSTSISAMLKPSFAAEKASIELYEKPELAARVAGLHYVSDVTAGFTRRKRGAQFVYLDLQGHPLKNERHLKRIKALVLPPAWSSVWICPDPHGHLQATGRDEKGRKQYRYHNNWNQIRNETKFSKLPLFASKLALIRKRVKKDLELSGLVRNKVLAAIVKIMDQTMIRIGNEEYAEKNKSYGLTTIRNQHAEVKGQKVRFKFKGKSGKFHDVEIEDPRIAKIVRKCQDLPGQELFEYQSEDGSYVDVSSQDVNDYLREITGENITAKDFRTWGGTVQAVLALQRIGPHETKTELKKNLVQAIRATADHLRNTTSVCKKYYIHPCVFEAYESGSLFDVHMKCQKKRKARQRGLYSEEVFALRLLESAMSKRS